MLGAGAVTGEHRDDVAQRLRDLRDEIVALEPTFPVPADLSRDGRSCAPARRRRWRILRACPALGLQHAVHDRLLEGQVEGAFIASPDLQEFARDDEFLHLGRAFVDAQRPDLAIEALDDLAALDAAAAEHLHGAIDDALRRLGRCHFGHRGLGGRGQLLHVAPPGGAIGEERGGVDVRRHVAERGLRELQVGERRAEHSPALRVRERLVESAPGEAERGRRDRGAEDIERAHGDLEAFARRAEPASSGNAAAVEAQGRERMRRHASMRSAIEKPGSSGKTRNAEIPRAPGASPVRANTCRRRRCRRSRSRFSRRRGDIRCPPRAPRRPSPRRRTRRPSPRGRRRRATRRAEPSAKRARAVPAEPAMATAPEPRPCMAKAKSASPSWQASVSRARQTRRESIAEASPS